MNPKVLVTIKGLQHSYEGLEENYIQTIQQGIYRKIADKHIITYEELPEKPDGSSPSPVKNLLKIHPGSVSLSKRGQTHTDMFFREGFHYTGLYRTPYGTLQTGFYTSKLIITEEPDCIDIQIDYDLELDYSHIADYSVYINIHSL